ncbi:MAG: winged helix-turn-helix domain-containing protein, partial [Ilumatobacteraceae bacterium]
MSVERAHTLSFLDAAEVVLRDAGVPMSPQEILERAVHLGLVTTNGATPSQTMKSKLSVDVLERHEGSRFMRSDPNRFALRSWKPAITEFFADRFQKALLDEEV